jgi:ribonuclease HII
LDEAGRGALAGPVAAGAIIFDPASVSEIELEGLRDSKQMTPHQRAVWSIRLREIALAWGVGYASNDEIDDLGISPATRLAMCRALEKMAISPQHLLIDFIRLPECSLPQTAIVKGDALSLTIAAASILAKTSRDTMLCENDERFPGYGFARHKGYGTAEHLRALDQLGPCELHRRSFSPVRTCLKKLEI